LRSKGFFARLANDWPAKVVSLIAAGLIFVFYRFNRLEERYISVPLQVLTNDEFVPASQVPDSVRITLRGESNDIFAVQEGDVAATIDLSSYQGEGVFRAPVQIEKRDSALGVDPLEIGADPAEVAVGIERRVSRVVPVTPSFRGFLAPGYELQSFELSPAEVEVHGPASAVARVSVVETEFIELGGRSADFGAKVKLLRKENLGFSSGIDAVEFSAAIRKAAAARTFENLTIAAVGLDPALKLAAPLPAGRIRLRDSNAQSESYAPSPGALSVDLSAIDGPGTYTLSVLALLPDGLQLDLYEPREVSVEIAAAGNRQ
jgi:hypothetical protein